MIMLNKEYIQFFEEISRNAKADILKMTTVAKSGHPGGSISSFDLFLVSFFFSNVFKNHSDVRNGKLDINELELSTEDDIDAFYISNGHTAPAWYALLSAFNIVDRKICNAGFRKIDSPFTGHVEQIIPFVSWDTGSLGQGLSAACGKALYYKSKNYKSNIWVYMGDGEQQKGQISEARRFINKYNLTNINILIDHNQLQVNGDIKDIMPVNILEEYKAAGFYVENIDGHNFNDIYVACKRAVEDKTRPHAIIAKTVSGKGISFMENVGKYVASVLSFDECRAALKELNIDDDLEELERIRFSYDYSKTSEYIHYINKSNMAINLLPNFIKKCSANLYREEQLDCKSAYGRTLTEIADELTDIQTFVFDCDLAIAVKTDDFRKKYPNNLIQCGIQEQHALACAGALSKENTLVFYTTFATFGLYEPYNQHNLNTLNNTNLKTVLTHSGMIGEDGKTHHCSNYIGVTNSLFNMKLILPADANQTDHAVRYAARTYGNFCLCLGRSPAPIIYDENGDIYFGPNYDFEYGKADIIFCSDVCYIISSGSVFGESYKAAIDLRKSGYNVGLINISAPLCLDSRIPEIIKGKYVLVVEDHNEKCGLYRNLTSFLFENGTEANVDHVGLSNYADSGNYYDLLVKYKLDKESIKSHVLNSMNLKK